MDRIAIIRANCGGFDQLHPCAKQDVDGVETIIFDDGGFPPREKAMTARMQARLPKILGWMYEPGFDYYLWVDASFAIESPKCVSWFLEKLGTRDMVVFKHPDRNTVKEEIEYIEKRIADGNKYLTDRYEGEYGDEQACYLLKEEYDDVHLFATCAIFYRNPEKIKTLRDTMLEWWAHTSAFHLVDQTSLPYAIWKHQCKVAIVDNNIYKIPYITYTRDK